jgi:hypothetical protein
MKVNITIVAATNTFGRYASGKKPRTFPVRCSVNSKIRNRKVWNTSGASNLDELIELCETNLASESTNKEKIDISDLLFFKEETFSQTITNYIKRNIKS